MSGEVVDRLDGDSDDVDVEAQAREAAKLASMAVENGTKQELEDIGHALLALARKRGGGS